MILFLFFILTIFAIMFIVRSDDAIMKDAYGRNWKIVHECYDSKEWWVIKYDTPYGTWHAFTDFRYENGYPVTCNDMFWSEEEAKKFLKSHIKWINEQKK